MQDMEARDTNVQDMENMQDMEMDFFGDEEGIFEEAEPEAEAQPEVEVPEQPEASEPPVADSMEPELLRVQFNGVERTLGREEAVSYAQKGMNYDHVHRQLEAYRNDEGVRMLDELAAAQGVSREAYMRSIKNAMEGQRRAALVNQGYSREAAEQMVQREREIEQLRAENTVFKEREKADAEKQRVRQQYAQFSAAYPDVDVTKIPKEVYQAAAQGEDLLSAYRAWDNAQLRARLAALENNDKAARQAPGSVTGQVPAKDAKKDPFEEAFWEEM